MPKKLRAGILGYGRMGREFVAAMQGNELWDVAAVYDICGRTRQLARQQIPGAAIHDTPDAIFGDASIDAVGLFTLADARPQQIRQALAHRKHVLAEKPIGPDVATEWQLVREIETSDRLVAVNLFNRNAWYHKDIQKFIAAGEIGDLAVIRICHMTPGHMPLEGHDPEGPPFHDCGMHYVDVARWYAKSEYQTWHAQGIRAWGYKDPWWVQAHGTFVNGVVFDITQGFIYGHLAKEQPHNCYVDAIGTKGVARMRHDFAQATVELHGVHKTLCKTAAFNDKKLDVMVDVFARSILAGTNLGFPASPRQRDRLRSELGDARRCHLACSTRPRHSRGNAADSGAPPQPGERIWSARKDAGVAREPIGAGLNDSLAPFRFGGVDQDRLWITNPEVPRPLSQLTVPKALTVRSLWSNREGLGHMTSKIKENEEFAQWFGEWIARTGKRRASSAHFPHANRTSGEERDLNQARTTSVAVEDSGLAEKCSPPY